MDFMKGMKKKEDLPEGMDLDMPPLPPKMMEEDDFSPKGPFDEELMPKGKPPAFPDFPEDKTYDLPGLPPLPKGPQGNKFVSPKIKQMKKGFLSLFKPKKPAKGPSIPQLEEEFPELPPFHEEEEFPPFPEEKPVAPPRPITPPGPIAHEEPIIPPRPIPPPIRSMEPMVEKPIRGVKGTKPAKKPAKKFIAIRDFKQINSYIFATRNILRGADDTFSEFEEARHSEDKEYTAFYNSLKDIQSKIMFVDKTLFKD